MSFAVRQSIFKDMIKFVEKLEEKGYAYFSNGNVYFDTSKFPAYGCLSGQRRDDMKHGARGNG